MVTRTGGPKGGLPASDSGAPWASQPGPLAGPRRHQCRLRASPATRHWEAELFACSASEVQSTPPGKPQLPAAVEPGLAAAGG